MKNWKNIDGHWMNLDDLDEIWVYCDPSTRQCNIRATRIRDQSPFELFDKCFKTREEAQKYLNKFMSKK